VENQIETSNLEAANRDREIRREKTRVARVREDRIRDLDSLFATYNQIQAVTGRAVTSLKEAMDLTLSLNQKLTSGSYREMNLVRRLKVHLMLQTFSAAINQLSRMSKLSKLLSPAVREEAVHQVESPPAFE
jgi:hypothetical protein